MIEDIASNLRKLAQARIYFGRHSVGRNMVSGLEELAAEHRVGGIRVVDLDREPEPPDPHLFAHSRIGSNRDPKGKIDAFAQRIRSGLRMPPDIALMKLCYVDFEPDTNVQEIFEYYRSAIERLSAEVPETRLLHATVPLTMRRLGLKERLKVVLGKRLWGDESNAKREEFSGLLRKAYPESDIVDIARLESTNPDATREQFTMDGTTHPSLSPAYTDDGGHLNAVGERVVAAELVRVLAHNIRRNA